MSRRIVAASPFVHTLFSGYSHGGFGYIPERAAFEQGGYGVESTLFSLSAAGAVVAEGTRILQDLATAACAA